MNRLAIALLALAAAHPATAQQIDGRYACTTSTFYLGDIVISGQTYRGPAYDGRFEEAHPIQVAGQNITWGGTLGPITAAGKVVSTVLRDGGFDITIESEGGNRQTINCVPG